MAGDMRDLANWCYDFGPRLVEAVNERKKMVVLSIVKDLTEATPIDTGAAISNWQVSLDGPVDTVIEPYAPSRLGSTELADFTRWQAAKSLGGGYKHYSGSPFDGGALNASSALDAATAVVAETLPTQVVYISNPVDYMSRLNEDGVSWQATPGFFERAIMFARDLADRAKLTV